MLPYYVPRKNSQGFTLIETLAVVIIVGILSAIAGPSFLAMFNINKVNDAVDQVRGALQEVQRQAIRRSNTCRVALTPGNQPKLTSNCFQIADYIIKTSGTAASGATTVNVDSLPVAISNGTKLVFSSGATGVVTVDAAAGSTSLTISDGISAAVASGEIVAFRTLPDRVVMATNVGSPIEIQFGIRGNTTFTDPTNPTASLPTDGKIILSNSDNPTSNMKCVALFSGIGIIRSGSFTSSGTYSGSIADINSGTCQES